MLPLLGLENSKINFSFEIFTENDVYKCVQRFNFMQTND